MTNLIKKAEQKVTALLGTEPDTRFMYHNLSHTRRVVESGAEIMEAEKVSKEDQEKVLLALWFHDTGFVNNIEKHEEESCKIAGSFLKELGKDSGFIKEVKSLIMATAADHTPTNHLEKIIKDADSSHLSKNNYRSVAELLREEREKLGVESHSVSEWRAENIKLLRVDHNYFTNYAKENWQSGKNKNIKRLIKDRKKEKRLINKEKLKAKFKGQSPDRGVQTLYRTTLRNHIKLSDIADTKSNILLSVNAIIISLALSNLIPKLDNPSNQYLLIPTAVFIVFSIISMILSITATRPNVTSGKFTREDVENRKVNLLFFGNFHKMGLAQYESAIEEVLKDQDYIYNSLTKDLYYLGVVLERKYRILRWTYTIFMLGMILSVIAFGVALKFYGPERIMDVVVL